MRIEQLLHGYQEGHGRLAGTLYNISPKDSARLSLMSDWSGYKDPTGKDHSYITAYMLEDSGLYVVAKSWYALEMERPGCVWTHSLLFNLADLSPAFDFRNLQRYFVRPKKGEYGTYNKPIEINDRDVTPETWEGKRPDKVSLMFILSTLLAGEERFYMRVELESWWYQQLCLTLLQYLPLEMLGRITMSSGGASLRKMEDELLTMQFVNMTEAISLVSPPWAEKLKESDFNVGLNIAVHAMFKGGNDVSSLIRIFSKDIGVEAKKYMAVCQLTGALFLGLRKEKTLAYEDVLGIVVSNFPTREEGQLIKENYLGERIVSLFCSEEDFLFYMGTMDHIEDAVSPGRIKLEERITKLTQDKSYQKLIERLLNSDILSAYGRMMLTDSGLYLNTDIIDAFDDDKWKGLLSYWGENQDYLLSDKWLSLHGERFNDVLWKFTRTENENYQYWPELLKTILENEAYLDDRLVDKFYVHVKDCSHQVLDYLNANDKLLRYDNLHVRPFRDVESLVKWLSGQEKITSLVERLIINYVWPSDSYIRESKPQIWHWMIDNDNGHKSPAYYVFMYEIAWQWKDDAVLKYYYHCFHHVHNSLANRTMTDRIWNRMYRYGGSVSLFQEWDRCLKLKKGIVGHLKNLGFSRAVFERFTPDGKINEQLVEIFDKMK